MSSESIPVFLNGRSVLIPPGATLGQLVAREDPALGAALHLGQARATDGRGIPVDAEQPLVPGAIFRVFRSARTLGGSADA